MDERFSTPSIFVELSDMEGRRSFLKTTSFAGVTVDLFFKLLRVS
jgi:hypothetical protein